MSMRKRLKKIFEVVVYGALSICFVALLMFLLLQMGLLSNMASVQFDKGKLQFVSSKITLLDSDNEIINDENHSSKIADINEVPQYVVDAFVSIEDKDFYKHNGLNYKRMIKAALNNLKAAKIKEGASTISQQLIKNTHLSNKKTFRRKFDEIVLAKELEKQLSKDEIMLGYLNAIYFGNGAFGLNDASEKYFSKQAKDLTLEEGALLAGIIKSPSLYSLAADKQLALRRRNLVLSQMMKDGKLKIDEYNAAKDKPIELDINSGFDEYSFYNQVIKEAANLLKMNEKELSLSDYVISTYFDKELQAVCESSLLSALKKNDNIDGATIVIDNISGGIKAFASKSDYNVLSLCRQPGSVLKPIISYAPALEQNKTYAISPILDEKTIFGDYSPQNYKNKYHGWVSVKDALANSYNIPSVKLLEGVGIENGKEFAKNIGIMFDKNDNGYSLALGGMTKGVRILDIANSYQCFANGGEKVKARFVKEIKTKDGKLLYKNSQTSQKCMKDSTAYLITDMLKEGVKSGTSRKLDLKGQIIAAKTGTAGVTNSNKNSDVWSVSYTPKNTLCVWCGATGDHLLDSNISGANLPTEIAQNIYKNYSLSSGDFVRPKSIVEKDISIIDYKSGKVMLAGKDMLDRYKMKAYFAIDNVPAMSDVASTINDLDWDICVEGRNGIITFDASGHIMYDIYRQDEDATSLVANILNKNGEIQVVDDKLKSGNFYTYYIVQTLNNFSGEKTYSKESEKKMIYIK